MDLSGSKARAGPDCRSCNLSNRVSRLSQSPSPLQPDNILLERDDEGDHLVFLLLRYFELVERLNQRLGRDLPVAFRDLQSGVNGLHLTPGVDAGAARRLAELIE